MHRAHLVEERRNDDARNLWLGRDILVVGALENRPRAERIAHSGNIAGDRAVAHRDQKLGVLTDVMNLAFVFNAADRALDKGDIDGIRVDS